ncbi:hypothetical protein EB796_004037 [Bugula neritina]|uniref:Uncharacterized protein n=1 Tax=Bugula neritina TaxID=10212 RepID=A0A7J7KHD2_BUGNE|nr:hypothetical protein EB796_004037 [Bugula neritina]
MRHLTLSVAAFVLVACMLTLTCGQGHKRTDFLYLDRVNAHTVSVFSVAMGDWLSVQRDVITRNIIGRCQLQSCTFVGEFNSTQIAERLRNHHYKFVNCIFQYGFLHQIDREWFKKRNADVICKIGGYDQFFGRTDSLCSLAKVQTYYDCMHQHALIHGIV